MSTRGRKRKHNPNIPAHIDQAALPRGLYWDNSGTGRWIVRESGGKAKTVAGRNAKLSDLHAIVEARAGNPARGTVAAVLADYHDSLEYKALAESTRAGYDDIAKAVKVYATAAGKLGDFFVDRMAPPFIRALRDEIAGGRPAKNGKKAIPPYPSKANHWLRYLRRAFGWGIEHGRCKTNPARGVKCVKEKRDPRMPTREAFRAVHDFARERGQRGAREKGSFPAYIWCAMELGYQARLRGIEVLTLTDAHIQGLLAENDADQKSVARLQTNRRKGSKDNKVRIGTRMREAIAALQAYRVQVWNPPPPKNPKAGKPRRVFVTPIRPEDRPLFVSEDGTQLTRSGFNTAFGRMIRAAVEAGVITKEQRFALHGLKHRGVTDTPGTRAKKKDASGHVTDSMASLYDHDLPAVEPADD